MDERALLKSANAGIAAAVLTDEANADGITAMTVRASGTSGHAYGAALDKLVAYAEQELDAAGLPGMTLCVVDAEGFAAVKSLGWADVDRRIPVNHLHLFEIGSISKSFAALCICRLADEGKIDLDSPLSRYLPDVPLPIEPIQVLQLLRNNTGLPLAAPVSPLVPEQRLWTGFTPGAGFSYSNTGYELIGKLVEDICGKPYPLALRELVIEPLGITGLREAVQASDRVHYAVGYSPVDASGPNMARVPLGQTQWINFDSAAANIGATADAMTRYIRFLIAVGRGQGAPLFSDAAAERFSKVLEPGATAAGIFGKGTAYASGLGVIDLDGRSALHHTGGMWGFTSSLTVDPVTGVGCFMSVNAVVGGYKPDSVSNYACRLLRYAREGGTSPSPEATSPDHIDSPEDYAGDYVAPNCDRFHLDASLGHLSLSTDDHEGRMQSAGEHGFLSDHPRFVSHFFNFERSGGAVVAVWFGSELYGRGAPVPKPATPPELAALQGIYVSEDPWSGLRRSVVAQGERLVIETLSFYRRRSTLRRKGDYWEGIENPCERIRFEAARNGVPQRLNVSGRILWRFAEIAPL